MIWPGIVQQFQVKPDRGRTRRRRTSQTNIDATRAAYDLEDVEVDDVHQRPSAGSDDQPTRARPSTASVPLVDPQLVHQTFEQIQQVRAYYSVRRRARRRPLRDRRHRPGAGARRPRARPERHHRRRDRNWSNLHTVYTHGNGMIAAYANQRPADDGAEGTEIQWAEGQQADQDALSEADRRLREPGLLRRAEPRLLHRRQARRGAADVELDLGDADGRRAARPRRTTATAASTVGSLVPPAAVRREVRRPELPAVRAGQREQQGALQPRPARAGARRSRRG